MEDRAGLWMRVDGPGGSSPLAFDNMEDRRISGTTEWQHHDVVLDVPAEAEAIALGVLLAGKGEVWMSDFNVDTVDLEFETTGSCPAAAEPAFEPRLLRAAYRHLTRMQGGSRMRGDCRVARDTRSRGLLEARGAVERRRSGASAKAP